MEMTIVPPVELDPDTVGELAERLAEAAQDDDVVVDFGAVTFCDSSGIRELVIAYRRQREGGGSLQVVNISDVVRRTFDIAGVSDRFLLDVG
jgi:anti-anti-sigma factor